MVVKGKETVAVEKVAAAVMVVVAEEVAGREMVAKGMTGARPELGVGSAMRSLLERLLL